MTGLIPADKGTHYVLLSVLALLALPLGWQECAAICAAVALLREAYGRWRRGVRMAQADWAESAQDVFAGMAGCAVVLASAWVGL